MDVVRISSLSVIALVACGRPTEIARMPATAAPVRVAPVTTVSAPAEMPAAMTEPEAIDSGPEPLVVRKGTRVLMFGDSMVTSGLGVTLEERVVALGGKWFHISKPSSTSATWSAERGRAVTELVDRARPDIVIIALSSNELFVPNPGARAGDIRSIVALLKGKPCVWIGPAPWRQEKGMLGVVRENSAPCRYFDSTGLAIARGPDGIHPTLEGGRAWAASVWSSVFEARPVSGTRFPGPGTDETR